VRWPAIRDRRSRWSAWGSALLGLNRAADAIVPLERAVAIEPSMDDGWYVLGRAYQAAGRTGQAQQAFATVERLRTERPR
jgi:cytochrome c-type biogenesis protein CcmH/NrfG